MPIFWLGGDDEDDAQEDGDKFQELPPPLRRMPCAMCGGKGWYWELVTSQRSFQP